MSNEVDELFSESARGATPRTGLVYGLVSVGLLIAITGLPCSAVPGGIVVLVGWYYAEKESARLEAGFFANDLRSDIRAARTIAISGVVFTAALFLIQFVLTWGGLYDQWWRQIVVLIGNLIWGPVPEA